MMKTLFTLFAALLLSGVAAQADVEFDGKVYLLGWEAAQEHAVIKEFYSQNQTTNTWTTMITLQAHPRARKVKQVSGPYFEARKSIVALKPKIHPKKTNDTSDVVLELFLGAPGKTAHLEFALVRFVETSSGVYVIAYSHKLPMSKKKNQDINVDVIVKERGKWIQQLLEIPIETIQQPFQAGPSGESGGETAPTAKSQLRRELPSTSQ